MLLNGLLRILNCAFKIGCNLIMNSCKSLEELNMNLNSNVNSNEDNFATNLYVALCEQYNIGENLLISPFLLEALLSLIYLGSNGKTAEELKAILQLKRFKTNAAIANYFAGNLTLITETEKNEATLLNICSQLWLDRLSEVNDEFKKIASTCFHTQIKELNFKNDLVHLKHLLNIDCGHNLNINIKQLWVVCIINFQYKWYLPFSPYRTGLSDFYMLNNLSKSTAMMYDNEMFVRYVELENFDVKIIELPYEHDAELIMLIMLPNKRDGLNELIQKLKHINFQEICEAMNMEEVNVLLPKFSINFQCALKPVLEKLGLKTFFNGGLNLTNVFNSTHACDGFFNFHHKVLIEVNETGSDITNETDLKPLNFNKTTTNLQQKIFHADHPFHFVIKTSNVILLMGHILEL